MLLRVYPCSWAGCRCGIFKHLKLLVYHAVLAHTRLIIPVSRIRPYILFQYPIPPPCSCFPTNPVEISVPQSSVKIAPILWESVNDEPSKTPSFWQHHMSITVSPKLQMGIAWWFPVFFTVIVHSWTNFCVRTILSSGHDFKDSKAVSALQSKGIQRSHSGSLEPSNST